MNEAQEARRISPDSVSVCGVDQARDPARRAVKGDGEAARAVRLARGRRRPPVCGGGGLRGRGGEGGPGVEDRGLEGVAVGEGLDGVVEAKGALLVPAGDDVVKVAEVLGERDLQVGVGPVRGVVEVGLDVLSPRVLLVLGKKEGEVLELVAVGDVAGAGLGALAEDALGDAGAGGLEGVAGRAVEPRVADLGGDDGENGLDGRVLEEGGEVVEGGGVDGRAREDLGDGRPVLVGLPRVVPRAGVVAALRRGRKEWEGEEGGEEMERGDGGEGVVVVREGWGGGGGGGRPRVSRCSRNLFTARVYGSSTL